MIIKKPLSEEELEIFTIKESNMSLLTQIKEWFFGKKKEEPTIADVQPTFDWDTVGEDLINHETKPILPPQPTPAVKDEKKKAPKKPTNAVKGTASTKAKPKKS